MVGPGDPADPVTDPVGVLVWLGDQTDPVRSGDPSNAVFDPVGVLVWSGDRTAALRARAVRAMAVGMYALGKGVGMG